jgi:hypothetical protein
MHKIFRKLLPDAKGSSEHIIAIIFDIRALTPFCQVVDSFDISNFLKIAYIKTIDQFFKDASFYKPTGDGLLIVMSCEGKPLKEIVTNTVKASLDLHKRFGTLFEDAELVNFPIPQKVGIGMARGTACRIESHGQTLDYSGRVINLASRLNNIARPSGVVFDSTFGVELLPPEVQRLFMTDYVYLRGIAEDKPILVHFTGRHTIISSSLKHPVKEASWVSDKFAMTLARLKDDNAKGIHLCRMVLHKKPLDENQIGIDIHFGPPQKGHRGAMLTKHHKGVKYQQSGSSYIITIEIPYLIDFFTRIGALDNDQVKFDVNYPVVEQ